MNRQFDPTLAARIETLAGKSTEGQLTEDERLEYVGHVQANKLASILNRRQPIHEDWFLEDASDAAIVRTTMDRRHIELWTTRRMPFEPRGVLLEARNTLRQALAKLHASSGEILQARYLSNQPALADVENVLIYNIGPATFGPACCFGLEFSRSMESPPPTSHSVVWQHYHSYRVASPDSDDAAGRQIAMTMQFSLPRLSSATKPHEVWWAARNGVNSLEPARLSLDHGFAMFVEVSGPTPLSSCAVIVKPLFDGIISALHFDATITDVEKVCDLLGVRLGVSPVEVAKALRATESGLLGQRRVVSCYRDFVKWNPADDLCARGQFVYRANQSSTWTVNVQVAPPTQI